MLFGAIPMVMFVEWEGKFRPIGREHCGGSGLVALRGRSVIWGIWSNGGVLYNFNSVEQVE